jgi:SNF2 family DNA or RNA helicase
LNYLESKQERIKFDVLLTSYEMVNLDTFILKSLHWECLVCVAHSFISQHPTHAN